MRQGCWQSKDVVQQPQRKQTPRLVTQWHKNTWVQLKLMDQSSMLLVVSTTITHPYREKCNPEPYNYSAVTHIECVADVS